MVRDEREREREGPCHYYRDNQYTWGDVSVPLMKLPEIWLSSLVCLKAGVIRVGLTDTFSPAPRLASRQRRDLCYWSTRAAIWGLSQEQGDHTWLGIIKKTQCAGPQGKAEENQCNV